MGCEGGAFWGLKGDGIQRHGHCDCRLLKRIRERERGGGGDTRCGGKDGEERLR